MRRISSFLILTISIIGFVFCGQPALLPYNPVANPDAVVQVANTNVRFTVLTPQLIRIERVQNNGDQFLDLATLAFLNRFFDQVPNFSQNINGGVLTIKTDNLYLTWTIGDDLSSLQIKSLDGTVSWSYGQANSGNLLGTIKSLDELDNISLNCTENANTTVHDEVLHCEVIFFFFFF